MAKIRIAGIYKITSPKGKIYIGQSVNVYSRLRSYKRINCDRQPKIYASLKKHGVDKHKFEILAECSESELDALESYYIELYQTFNNKYGLNLESGGRRNRQISPETRLKISLSNKNRVSPNKGIPMSEEQKIKISISNKGKPVSIKTREKLRNFNLGKKHSAETLLKMSWFKKEKKYH